MRRILNNVGRSNGVAGNLMPRRKTSWLHATSFEVDIMAEPMRNAAELQKQLNEFQDLQRQLQYLVSQRQQLMMQVEEIKLAEAELAKADKGVYRVIGPLLLETTKTDANSTLKERRELFESRSGVLAKQEERVRPRLEELRTKLEAALSQNKVSK